MASSPVDPTRVYICSLYMTNIEPAMLAAQEAVMKKFNPGYAYHQDLTPMDHGSSFDTIMKMAAESPLAQDGPVVIMFLDIDCIPLHPKALDYFIEQAWNGHLVGHAQRSNHLMNDQHLYAGSPCVALSVATYEALGRPSARPTPRGDVGEEWTYAAEERGVPVDLVMPVRFDAPPFRMRWESDTRLYWPLKEEDEAHRYGIGTTYRVPGLDVDAMWHMFQSFHPGQLERFVNKCNEVLNV